MFIPDTLSRAALPDSTPEIPSAEIEAHIHSVITNIPMSDNRLSQFQTETANDPTLQKLKEYINSEWPKSHQIHHLTKPYFSIRDELNINADLILKVFHCTTILSLIHI